jgi:hypothetical protein
MLKVSVNAIIQKICEETTLSEAEIKERIKTKIKELEGLVSEEGAAFIVAAELGVQIMRDSVSIAHKISELKPGDRDIELVCTINKIFQTVPYVHKGIAKEVSSMQVFDDSGQIRVVMWDDKAKLASELKVGQKIKIKGSQVKLNNNRLELHVGKYGLITVLQTESDAKLVSQNITLDKLEVGEFVTVLADIVDIREPKFYLVCPNCNKKVVPAVEGFLCPEHKQVMPKETLLCSFVIDDGFAAVRAVAFGSVAEKLLGLKIADMKTIESLQLLDTIRTRLLGKTVLVEGRVKENKNLSTFEIIISNINLEPNPREIANNLLQMRVKNG